MSRLDIGRWLEDYGAEEARKTLARVPYCESLQAPNLFRCGRSLGLPEEVTVLTRTTSKVLGADKVLKAIEDGLCFEEGGRFFVRSWFRNSEIHSHGWNEVFSAALTWKQRHDSRQKRPRTLTPQAGPAGFRVIAVRQVAAATALLLGIIR